MDQFTLIITKKRSQPWGYLGNLQVILRWALLLAVLVVMILRDTRYITQPRFWAEEGSLHFAYSYSHPWPQALFEPQVGYLNFWPNLATIFATIPSLESAPLVTTLFALFIQLIPVSLILFSRSVFWQPFWRKLIGTAVLLFVPLSAEVWLNSVTSYNHLAAAAFLILIVDAPETTIRRWAYSIVLLIAGLTGTLSCFLIPLFVAQWLAERNSERLKQLLLLIFCAVVQVVLILTDQSSASLGDRFHLLGLSTLGVTIWTQGLALFTAGYDMTREWALALYSLASQDISSFQAWGRPMLAAGGFVLIFLSHNIPLRRRLLFLASYGILLILPMAFSIIEEKYSLSITGLHQRLFFAPNMILGWMLLSGVHFSKEKGLRALISNTASAGCVIVLASALFWGAISFYRPWHLTAYWPDWHQEVAAWQINANHPLQIQPEGWSVQLSKSDR